MSNLNKKVEIFKTIFANLIFFYFFQVYNIFMTIFAIFLKIISGGGTLLVCKKSDISTRSKINVNSKKKFKII